MQLSLNWRNEILNLRKGSTKQIAYGLISFDSDEVGCNRVAQDDNSSKFGIENSGRVSCDLDDIIAFDDDFEEVWCPM